MNSDGEEKIKNRKTLKKKKTEVVINPSDKMTKYLNK